MNGSDTDAQTAVIAELSEADARDALYILPLATIPLHTPGLRGAKLIKNARLDSVVEVFSAAEGTGSGQLDIAGLGGVFGWEDPDTHPDFKVLTALGTLHSYDVYSLRLTLRDLGIPVNAVEDLRLSPSKTAQLSGYMKLFTRPLVAQIYGDDTIDVEDFDDIVALFRHPDRQRALTSLKKMAASLKIEVSELPRFLENYGDIFLSLSYFRSCFDSIAPVLNLFIDSLGAIRSNWQLKNDENLIKTCDRLARVFSAAQQMIDARLSAFEADSRDLTQNLTAARYRRLEEKIRGDHVMVGGLLCGLWVKMSAFYAQFPDLENGGPVQRGEFIMSELRQGLGKYREISQAVPVSSND